MERAISDAFPVRAFEDRPRSVLCVRFVRFCFNRAETAIAATRLWTAARSMNILDEEEGTEAAWRVPVAFVDHCPQGFNEVRRPATPIHRAGAGHDECEPVPFETRAAGLCNTLRMNAALPTAPWGSPTRRWRSLWLKSLRPSGVYYSVPKMASRANARMQEVEGVTFIDHSARAAGMDTRRPGEL